MLKKVKTKVVAFFNNLPVWGKIVSLVIVVAIIAGLLTFIISNIKWIVLIGAAIVIIGAGGYLLYKKYKPTK